MHTNIEDRFHKRHIENMNYILDTTILKTSYFLLPLQITYVLCKI